MAKKFLRRGWNKKSQLGRGRKNKQKWRKPKGRHNKMREKRKGYAKTVSIGYGKPKKERAKTLKTVRNVKDITKMKKGETATLSKVGRKNRIEIARKAEELGIKICNLNVRKFLDEAEKQKSSGKGNENKTAKAEAGREEKR
ncbi:MAG TPA: eL32 family ribosomal protein [Candidatus Nanoarchaeia archaeon]|nr:eL32 family ribosomal protein [Candidatus Nanoarchaeia archaeon]